MTNEKAIMCLEDMKIKVPIPKAAKQARENNEALDVAIKALQNVPHWIPVTERLPETEGRYIVVNSKIGAWHVDIDFYRPYMGGWMYGQGVLAWMPLPEPYKGVTE